MPELEANRTDDGPALPVQMVDVVRVRTVSAHRLWIKFSDGTSGERDFAPGIKKPGPLLKPLKDPAYFAKAFIELGALVWPNGYDWDPIHLHNLMMQAGELSPAAAE